MDEKWIAYIASLGQRALLQEALLLPKPGLVDPISCGAHRDMDIFTFIDSCEALEAAFADFVRIGADHVSAEPRAVQRLLRERGILAEQEMFQATRGINTHKGILYSMAFCLCAVGRVLQREFGTFFEGAVAPSGTWANRLQDCREFLSAVRKSEEKNVEQLIADLPNRLFNKCEPILRSEGGSSRDPELIRRVIAEVRILSAGLLAQDMEKARKKQCMTAGERFYFEYGLGGVRGEVEKGFPTARIAYELLKDRGSMEQEHLLRALMRIMSKNDDTNVIARGGTGALSEVKRRSAEILQLDKDAMFAALGDMDVRCIEQNISPGGSADLLSVAIFLYLINHGG